MDQTLFPPNHLASLNVAALAQLVSTRRYGALTSSQSSLLGPSSSTPSPIDLTSHSAAAAGTAPGGTTEAAPQRPEEHEAPASHSLQRFASIEDILGGGALPSLTQRAVDASNPQAPRESSPLQGPLLPLSRLRLHGLDSRSLEALLAGTRSPNLLNSTSPQQLLDSSSLKSPLEASAGQRVDGLHLKASSQQLLPQSAPLLVSRSSQTGGARSPLEGCSASTSSASSHSHSRAAVATSELSSLIKNTFMGCAIRSADAAAPQQPHPGLEGALRTIDQGASHPGNAAGGSKASAAEEPAANTAKAPVAFLSGTARSVAAEGGEAEVPSSENTSSTPEQANDGSDAIACSSGFPGGTVKIEDVLGECLADSQHPTWGLEGCSLEWDMGSLDNFLGEMTGCKLQAEANHATTERLTPETTPCVEAVTPASTPPTAELRPTQESPCDQQRQAAGTKKLQVQVPAPAAKASLGASHQPSGGPTKCSSSPVKRDPEVERPTHSAEKPVKSTTKSILEKRRREKINHAFAELRSAMETNGDMATVLLEASQLVKKQKRLIENLQKQIYIHQVLRTGNNT